MRPDSIRKFDLFYLGGIAVSLIGMVLAMGAITARAEAELARAGVDASAGGVMWSAIALSVIIGLLLWYLVSRQRIEMVKLVLLVFLVWGAIGIPALFADGVQTHDAFNLVAFALQAAAIWFLFRPDAKAWFAAKRGAGDGL